MVNTSRKTKIVATVGQCRGGSAGLLFDGRNQRVTRKLTHGEMLTWFIQAGADLIRLNMSFAGRGETYGSNEAQYLKWLNENKNDIARRVAVLGDLPGPKIRLTGVTVPRKNGEVRRGDTMYLNFGTAEFPKDAEITARVEVNGLPFNDQVRRIDTSPNIGAFLRQKDEARFAVGDGKVRLKAVSESQNVVRCDVTKGGRLVDGKGLTMIGASLKVEAFGPQDQKALDFLMEHGGELLAFVAVSFVQSRDDILNVKKFISDRYGEARAEQSTEKSHPSVPTGPGVIAKIETRDAWENFDTILDVADGIMVARGDLGEQLPIEEIPIIQKELIRKCMIRGKPVITATQMLDSMEDHPEPTRAEATDVFNAIYDGTDAVMLSGETSVGCYPMQAIEMMDKIARQAERFYFLPRNRRDFEAILNESRLLGPVHIARFQQEAGLALGRAQQFGNDHPLAKRFRWQAQIYAEKQFKSQQQANTDRLCKAACALSEEGTLKPIIAPTTSGRTVFLISRFRPKAPIIGAAHGERVYRKLLLSFGVYPVHIGWTHDSVADVLARAVTCAREFDLLNLDGVQALEAVATSGTPLFMLGATNLLQIIPIDECSDWR